MTKRKTYHVVNDRQYRGKDGKWIECVCANCPKCGSSIFMHLLVKHTHKFCFHCGTALDWTGIKLLRSDD